MRWYTADYGAVLYEEWFHCDDLGVQLVPVIARFKETEAFRTGVPSSPPAPPRVRIVAGRRMGAWMGFFADPMPCPTHRPALALHPLALSSTRSRSTMRCGPRRLSACAT